MRGDGLRDWQRERQPPPLGRGRHLRARCRPGARCRLRSRAARAARRAVDQPDVLGREAQPVARAGCLAVPRAWEALPPPRACPPLQAVGGWRPDGRVRLPAARERLLPLCRPSPVRLASRRQRRRQRRRRHRQVRLRQEGGGVEQGRRLAWRRRRGGQRRRRRRLRQRWWRRGGRIVAGTGLLPSCSGSGGGSGGAPRFDALARRRRLGGLQPYMYQSR